MLYVQKDGLRLINLMIVQHIVVGTVVNKIKDGRLLNLSIGKFSGSINCIRV